MKDLEFLLNKYKKIKPPDETIKVLFIKVVEKTTGIILKKEKIKIHQKTIYIKSSSVEKNEIRINQTEILKSINKELGENSTLVAIF